MTTLNIRLQIVYDSPLTYTGKQKLLFWITVTLNKLNAIVGKSVFQYRYTSEIYIFPEIFPENLIS